jgi:hypothetical protein
MEELFTATMRSLSGAAQCLDKELLKTKKFIPASPDVDWNEYGDSLRALHTRLNELNAIMYKEYPFGEGLPEDIINYTKYLEEAGTECDELVRYLLCRDQVFSNDNFIKNETLFLKEVLNGIIDHSDRISSLLAVSS